MSFFVCVIFFFQFRITWHFCNVVFCNVRKLIWLIIYLDLLTSPFISPSPVIWCIVKPSFPKFTWNFENFRTVKFIKTKSKFEVDLLGRWEWKRWRYFQFVWFQTYFRLILTVWILNKQNMIAHIDKHMANRSHTVNLQLSLVTSLSP